MFRICLYKNDFVLIIFSADLIIIGSLAFCQSFLLSSLLLCFIICQSMRGPHYLLNVCFFVKECFQINHKMADYLCCYFSISIPHYAVLNIFVKKLTSRRIVEEASNCSINV